MTARLTIALRIAVLLPLLLCTCAGTTAMGQSVLLVHDAGASPSAAERQAISWTRDLLGHFSTQVAVAQPQTYAPGTISAYDVTIFLGLRSAGAIPEAFVADCAKAKTPVCWVGAHVDELLAQTDRYGFALAAGEPAARGTRVSYKGANLRREAISLPSLTITASDRCRPVAMIEGGPRPTPYAIRSGTFWYFPELPITAARTGSAHLVLCDAMHEITGDLHEVRRTALVYVAGVTPSTDAGKLDALVRSLQGLGAPFAVEVTPAVTSSGSGRPVLLEERRLLVSVLRGAQRAGASIIAVLPDRDVQADSSHRIDETVTQLARCGLYPVAASARLRGYGDAERASLAKLCSVVVDRPGSADYGLAPLPFLIASNEHGECVMPGNLPVLTQGRGEVEAMLDAARRQSIVPDPWVTAGIAVGAPLVSVSLLIGGLQDAGYGFHDLRFSDSGVRAGSLLVRTVRAEYRLGELLPTGWSATVLGPEAGARQKLDLPGEEQRHETVIHPGSLLVGYPSGKMPGVVFSLEGDPEQVAQRAVHRLAQVIVLLAIAAGAVLFAIYLIQLAERRGA